MQFSAIYEILEFIEKNINEMTKEDYIDAFYIVSYKS